MHLANANIATRCEFISGSFFETIPSGADAYILKNIIHDWDDERSAEILRNCRRVIGPDAKLLIVERIMPTRLESTESHRVLARADLAMLVGLHGRERTEAEYRALLDSAGFNLTQVLPMALEFNIIEAVPRKTA